MAFESINPANGEILGHFDEFSDQQTSAAIARAAEVAPGWADTPINDRCQLIAQIGVELRNNIDPLAKLITQEMGKLYRESKAEIEKCALACDFYANSAPAFLDNHIIASDASKSYVAYQPLGTVLAVMPWNFPFWQVMRCAAPVIAGGNTLLLKHASNVPQCALALEDVFVKAGFPAGVFKTLMISAAKVEKVISDDRVHAVSLTGSEKAGRQVAATAGANLKKTVLELGGSDAFVVLEDADLQKAVANAVKSRYLNAGQSCIAAKRFIVVENIADQFVAEFKVAVEKLKMGDPMLDSTNLAPMARSDLRGQLHIQVEKSLAKGAIKVTGCEPLDGPGVFYRPSIIDRVEPRMVAYEEELFGPVAIVIRAKDESGALKIANDSRYGLAGSVWTQDIKRGEKFALQTQSGAVFVNGMVKSDPRLPFGGIKASGYGRELSNFGILEFVNAKTVWIG